MKTLFTILVLFFSSSLIAEIINIKCKIELPINSDEFKSKIDIEEKFMQFGSITYDITKITDEYITGVSNSKDDTVGHDVWVQNRNNGNFIRVYVFPVCVDNGCSKIKKLKTKSYEGNCKKDAKLF